MDKDIAKWILEFLLRQRMNEEVINGFLSSLRITDKDKDNGLKKKTILLRRIESKTSIGSVSERLLDLLEIIKDLDQRASESMTKAYCAVAVDCTIRVLEEKGNYLDAVQRVWRERVCKADGLVSEESNRWLQEIESAVSDSDVRRKISMRNTRDEALKAVRVYLTEAWGCLVPIFLELVSDKFRYSNRVEGLCGAGGSGNATGVEVPFQGNQNIGQAVLRREHFAMKSKRSGGANISDVDEGNEDESRNKTRETHAPRESEKKDDPKRDVEGYEGQNRRKLPNLPRHSLMDANGTSHTFECVVSIDTLSRDLPSRPLLPCPKEIKCSPLNNHDNITKFDRSSRAKKKYMKWTTLEEDALLFGVRKLGVGKWSQILHRYSEIFQGRTHINLKDKWRNMMVDEWNNRRKEVDLMDKERNVKGPYSLPQKCSRFGICIKQYGHFLFISLFVFSLSFYFYFLSSGVIE